MFVAIQLIIHLITALTAQSYISNFPR